MNGSWHEKTAARERFCLNGEWQFQPLQGDWQVAPAIGDVDGYDWKLSMRVPGTWGGQTGSWTYKSEFLEGPALSAVSECLRVWYKRSFFVPAEWAGRQITLEFGGVGYKAAVYVNRQAAGTHVGGRTPFEIDITSFAKPGQINELLVYNTAFHKNGTRSPEGAINFNGESGLWGDVYLRATSRVYVHDVYVKTSVRNKRLTAIFEIANADTSPHTITVENVILDGKESVLTLPAKQVTVPAQGMSKLEIEQPWPNPHLWSLEDPHLYHLSTRITKDAKLIDDKATRFGFREFWIDGKNFRLNGEIVRLRAFPFGLAEGPPQMRPEYMRGWFKLMKEKLGHNAIRFQWIFLTDNAAKIADEEGLLIEEATGFVGGDQGALWNWPEANVTIKKEIREWIRARRNHPSIVLWSTNNECWSMVDVKKCRDGDPEAVGEYNWLLGVGNWIRENDDTRIVTNHSLGDMFDWTQSYDDEWFEAGDLMGKADNYNLHYPQEYRFKAEEADVGKWWAAHKNKPLIVGEFSGINTTMPGCEASFVINGEDFVKVQGVESEAMYYYFRRVVGAWRAAGTSGIFAWAPNLYVLKLAIPTQHRFLWDDLTTPGLKPIRAPYAFYNPGWDKTKPEYIPDNTDPRYNNHFWDMLADTFSPLLINLGGNYWEHNYLSGEKVSKKATIVNDTPAAQEVTWSWELQDSGRRVAGDTRKLKLARAEIRKVSFDVTLPRVMQRKELTLKLTAKAGSFNSSDRLDITLYPTQSVAAPKFQQARVALYDKSGKTGAVLRRAGIRYHLLNNIVGDLKSSRYDVLVIGCDSADASLKATVMGVPVTSPKDIVREFVNSGGRALFFEQGRGTFDTLNFFFPGIPVPPIKFASPTYAPCSYEDVAAPGHPVFKGLKKGLSLWTGEYGRVSEFSVPRQYGSRTRPLLFAGRWGTSLLEGMHGKGRFILCQANVTTRYGLDPEATILMHNLLSYTLSAQPPVGVRAARIGDVGGFLGGFEKANMSEGFSADDLTDKLASTDLAKYGVLILGRGTVSAGSEILRNAQKILSFARAGGTVFALPQSAGTFKGDWLPGRVALREMSSQWIFKEATQSPLIWGVSAFDLAPYHAYGYAKGGLLNVWPQPKVTAEMHDWSPEWSSLLLVSQAPKNWGFDLNKPVGGVYPTGGSALLERKYGKGRIILCQLDLDKNCAALPAEVFKAFPVANSNTDRNVGSTYGTEGIGPRLVADTLLTNLGLGAVK